jgi:TrmH family RNA methyltransferase
LTNQISSLQNPRVKDVIRLRDRRHRDKQQRILIDGVRELGRAIGAGIRLREVYFCPELGIDAQAQTVLDAASACAELISVTRPVFDRLAFGDRAEGVLGVAQMPTPSLDALVLPANPLVAVLEGVEKPGNVGAVLRSADAAGVSALVVADPRTDLYNPNTIRASLGTVFTVPVCMATVADTLAWLRQMGLKVYAARVDGSVPYTEVDYRIPAAVVLGSEAQGLSPAWSHPDITAVSLPMLGVADSLNVSVTAAVLFYEALRQRSK